VGFGLVVSFTGICLFAGYIHSSERACYSLMVYHQQLGHLSIYKVGGIDNYETDPALYEINENEVKIIEEAISELGDKIEMINRTIATSALLSNGQFSIPIWFRGISPEVERFARQHPLVKKWTPEVLKMYSGKDLSAWTQQIPETISVSGGVADKIGLSDIRTPSFSEEAQLTVAARGLEGDLNASNVYVGIKHATGMAYLEEVSVLGAISVLQELLRTQGLGHFTLFLKDPSDSAEVILHLKKVISEKKLDLEVIPFVDDRIGSYYNGIVSFLVSLGVFYALLVFGATALIIVNSMTMAIIERSREIGSLRSIGYTPQRVRGLFVKESVWLGLMASIAGILVTEVCAFVVSLIRLTYTPPGLNFPLEISVASLPWFYLLLSLVMTLLSMLTSYWVVGKKTSLPIAKLFMDPETT
jgi:putative ABC transport system permease protein